MEDEAAREAEAAPAGDGAAKTNEVPSQSQRIVSGTEVERPMKVTLDLDVYKFPAE
jgi:hypothetical protein